MVWGASADDREKPKGESCGQETGSVDADATLLSHVTNPRADELLAAETFCSFLLTVAHQAMAELHRGNRQ